MTYSLIANTGIHITSFPIEINSRDKFSVWFHEWLDATNGEWKLEIMHEIPTDEQVYYYRKRDLFDKGYFASADYEYTIQDLYDDGIKPVKVDEDMQEDNTGEIFKYSLNERGTNLANFEGKWLPLPYFIRRGQSNYKFGPVNWSRFKLIPVGTGKEGVKRYTVLLAFDTRTGMEKDKYDECPVFSNQYETELKFGVCQQEFYLMDFCSPREEWKYIDDYLLHLVNPNVSNAAGIKSGHKLSYIASFFLLVDYIAQNNLFPQVTLYRDSGVETKDVDMVVDIGNSRTTALLVEDNSNFNQISQLQLIDYTSMSDNDGRINTYQEPFDMRLALRKVDFGDFGIINSRQFVYPSIVRLGKEASHLIHIATESGNMKGGVTTLSSPKRYLWDGRKSREEWNFITLPGERDDHILNIPGITEYLRSDGSLALDGTGGQTYHYSRRSMMMFAFLEMLVQAETQINSNKYRNDRGRVDMPRRIRRIVVTCPTTLSKIERESLVRCASDALKLLNKFYGADNKVEIIPAPPSYKDKDSHWYYDEATCSQLVYMYGEVGYKYKGSCEEFFELYGKKGGKPQLTVGSLDIGGGTSDLMISNYTYKTESVTTLQPTPLFYDSYYFAGDDMLYELIRNVMFNSRSSALRKNVQGPTEFTYKQKLRDFFGPDHAGQTDADRRLRRDFNLQYSIPLMYRMLELLSRDSSDCNIRYADVFDGDEPNASVKEGFKRFFGVSLEELVWEYKEEEVSDVVYRAFEPLLKKIATIMYSYKCDIILLSGRPSSLAPIRNIFLKYYPVSPNRLILLNNYFVGHWYPFGNNTGYISNPKTIVAMGALIGYYASSLGNLDRFALDKSKLDEELTSVVKYIEATPEKLPVEYLITPQRSSGEMTVSSLPAKLRVRQLGIDSYPSRTLYVIDFNYYKISEQIRKKTHEAGETITDQEVTARTKEEVNDLRRGLPFNLTVEQDADNREKLTITAITDKYGRDINNGRVEVNIQSLGVDDLYWLDTGIFEIL